VAEVEREAQLHIRLFEFGEMRTLQERLMKRDRTTDLSLGAVQVAQNHLDFERVGARACRLRQLVDRLVHVVVDEEIQTQHVVRRFAQPALSIQRPSRSL
jgi:hypothetical protein